MGLKKTRLIRGDRYGLLKAAELAAQMIRDYERRRDGARQISVETLDEELWDDVLVSYEAVTHRWQVKRLMADLPVASATKLVAKAASPAASPTLFHLGVASFVSITRGSTAVCGLRELADLCDDARTPGLVHERFAKTHAKSPAFKFFRNCLTAGDDSAVVTTLQRLHVRELGTEQILLERAVQHLDDLFTNADELVRQIHHWFIERPDGRIVVDVNLLYREVVDSFGNRDVARVPWVHLARDRVFPRWDVHGPVRIADLVDRAWNPLQATTVELGAQPQLADAASAAIGRLVLHASPRATASADGPEWRDLCLSSCAGTLGTSTAAPSLMFYDVPSAPNHPPRDQVLEDELARSLSERMDATLWPRYVDAVAKELGAREIETTLRRTMRQVWSTWLAALSAATHQQSFLGAMLATAEEWERSDFDRSARRGPHAVDTLARATVTALAIAAAFSGASTTAQVGDDGAVENLRIGDVSARVVALTAASHPETRRPSRFSDSPASMLAHEPGLTILGAVDASPSELQDRACAEAVPFHASEEAVENYRHLGRPPALLTSTPLLGHAMRDGLPAVQKYVAEVLKQAHSEMLAGLKRAVAGADADA